MRSSLAGLVAPKLDSILSWARSIGALTVIGNVSSLSATALVTSGLGFVFWSVTARVAPPAAVGLAAAAVSASTLLATMSMLGLGTLLIGEIAADGPKQGSLLTTSLLVVVVFGSLLGLAFAMVGPAFVQELQPLRGGWPSVSLFALAAGSTAVGLLVDQLMIGQLRGELQLARNTLYALAKLGLLVAVVPLMAVFSNQGLLIFATWPLGNLLSLLAIWTFLVWKPIGLRLARPDFSLLRRLGGRALGHHALNLSLQAPSLALPLLVTIMLSATANAYFYTAWMIASVAFLPQTALAVTLFAIGAREPAALVSRARLPCCLGSPRDSRHRRDPVRGGLVAGCLRGRYAAEASSTLRILGTRRDPDRHQDPLRGSVAGPQTGRSGQHRRGGWRGCRAGCSRYRRQAGRPARLEHRLAAGHVRRGCVYGADRCGARPCHPSAWFARVSGAVPRG